MIPKLIHQVWFDMGNGVTVPDKYKPMNDSKRRHMKEEDGWRYVLWNEAMSNQLLQDHYPWFIPYYQTFKNKICQADAIRYFVLHRYGGVYLDQDLTIHKSLEPLLQNRDAVFIHDCPKCSKGHLDYHQLVVSQHPSDPSVTKLQSLYELGVTSANNFFMASVPRHPVFAFLTRQLIVSHGSPEHVANSYLSVLQTTGPVFLERSLRDYWEHHDERKHSIYILPQFCMSTSKLPAPVLKQLRDEYKKNTLLSREWFHADHDYDGTWIVNRKGKKRNPIRFGKKHKSRELSKPPAVNQSGSTTVTQGVVGIAVPLLTAVMSIGLLLLLAVKK